MNRKVKREFWCLVFSSHVGIVDKYREFKVLAKDKNQLFSKIEQKIVHSKAIIEAYGGGIYSLIPIYVIVCGQSDVVESVRNKRNILLVEYYATKGRSGSFAISEPGVLTDNLVL